MSPIHFNPMANDDFPVRLQIVVGDILVAECIVPYSMADVTWAKWCRIRDKKGLPLGGSIESRADLPRRFNVPVGSKID